MRTVCVARIAPGLPTAPRLPPPPPTGESRIVLEPDEQEVLTARREVDARTALTRGLREYLAQLSITDEGGAEHRFLEVMDVWAEPEDVARLPSAAIYGAARGRYDASSFTPALSLSQRIPLPDGRWVVKPCEYVQDFVIDVWAAEPDVRSILAAMVEEELSPVDWMYGMHLVVPYYHSAVAAFSAVDADYQDSEADAQKRWRRAKFIVTGRIPVLRIKGIPLMDPTIKLTVDAGPEEIIHAAP